MRAWGHGPLDGAVDIARGNVIVNYKMPRVAPGEFAEARIVFPAAWVPGLAASGEARLQTVLDEEQAWADEANARRERACIESALAASAQLGGGAVLLAVALWGRFKNLPALLPYVRRSISATSLLRSSPRCFPRLWPTGRLSRARSWPPS